MTYALHPAPPMMSRVIAGALVFLAACFGLVLGLALGELAPALAPNFRIVTGAAGAAVGVALVVVYWRRLTRPTVRPPIRVTDTEVVFPQRNLRLADITSIEEGELGKQRVLLIGTADTGPVVMPVSHFVEPAAAAALREHLHAAIAARPSGAEQLAAMRALEAGARAMNAVKPRATYALLALIAVMFSAELVSGLDDKAGVLRLGANAPALVRDGQWWRLFTANFLHLSWLHIILNALALSSLGALLERALGAPRFLAAALLAGLSGNLASMIFGDHVYSAGASSMIFGLLGALLVVNLLHRGRLPASLALSKRRWAGVLGTNLVISLLPGVDALAHAGGLIAGALVMLVLARSLDPPALSSPRARTPLRFASIAAAVALAVPYVAAIGVGAHYVLYAEASRTADLASARFGARGANALNQAAWETAIDPASTPAQLARAEDAARRALALKPDDAGIVDTHAYVLLRLGRADEAFDLERAVVWREDKASLWTMLLRMLEDRAAREPPGAAIAIRRVGDELTVAGVDATAHGAVVFARADHAGQRGLLRVVVPPGTGAARTTAPADLPSSARLTVLFADVAADRPERAAVATATYVGADAETLTLPWAPAR